MSFVGTERAEASASAGAIAMSVENLCTAFSTFRGEVMALEDVSFELRKGEMLGIVGESGAGKTVLGQSLINQVRFPGRVRSGRVLLEGHDLLRLGEKELNRIRGKRIGSISSTPRASLDPLATVGRQLGRAILAHEKVDSKAVYERVIQSLERVQVPDARRRHNAYPHELSVGMAQRVVIAMALLHSPEVIIADEPTAGLDVTVQRQVLGLMKEMHTTLSSATIIVTRDLGIVAQYCTRVAVMKSGRVLEDTDVQEFFKSPRTPYSRKLLDRALTRGTTTGFPSATQPLEPGDANSRLTRGQATPREETGAEDASILCVRDLVKHFPLRGSRLSVNAVNGVSFDVRPGEALGIVGESGSGKTTIGRLILRLIEPTAGQILFEDTDITATSQRALRLRGVRSRLQMVFQEPHASLNAHRSIARNVEESLINQGTLGPAARRERVREVLQLVQLGDECLELYPHNLSAGQAQRVGIARAIVTNPRVVVLDEPTSLLDISVGGEIIELLIRIKDDLQMAYVFISHDLAAVRDICSRIAITYLGKIVEIGETEKLFRVQRHPYSKALLASVLHPDPDARAPAFALSGEIPSPVELPSGCHLHPRCPIAESDCLLAYPPLAEQEPGRAVSCYHSDRLVALEEGPREEWRKGMVGKDSRTSGDGLREPEERGGGE
jgi:oligopeptide/dipeptide ABC transporter ATP-binding protein